jgi:hypothetical protein
LIVQFWFKKESRPVTESLQTKSNEDYASEHKPINEWAFVWLNAVVKFCQPNNVNAEVGKMKLLVLYRNR